MIDPSTLSTAELAERLLTCRVTATSQAAWATVEVVGAELIAEAARRLTATCATLEAARKDAVYHADCRPNRKQAEAWRNDAKAMNDRWADEVAAHRATREALAAKDERYTDLAEHYEALREELAAKDAEIAQLREARDVEESQATFQLPYPCQLLGFGDTALDEPVDVRAGEEIVAISRNGKLVSWARVRPTSASGLPQPAPGRDA